MLRLTIRRLVVASIPTNPAATSSNSKTGQRVRGAKRRNYADGDGMMGDEHSRDAEASSILSTSSSSNNSVCFEDGDDARFHYTGPLLSVDSPYCARSAALLPPVSPTNSFSAVVRRRRQTAMLNLLQAPTVGGLFAHFLRSFGSYAAYAGTGGRIHFYIRKTTAPGLDEEPSAEEAHRGILSNKTLSCIYVGKSPIHGRGLLTSKPLPRGTRIIAEPQRGFLDAVGYLRLLSDTREKLPDTWHYTHPPGALAELVSQSQPHHLLNHSCAANVVCGLSQALWPASLLDPSKDGLSQNPQTPSQTTALLSDDDLRERLLHWKHFSDPNSFFLSRDVAAGEELTLDYSKRTAPLSSADGVDGCGGAGASPSVLSSLLGLTSASPSPHNLLACHCGDPACRQFVYAAAQGSTAPAIDPGMSFSEAVHALLRSGYDDETVLLSLATARDRSRVVDYLHNRTSLNASAPLSFVMEHHMASKRNILASYRHVFRALNEVVPV